MQTRNPEDTQIHMRLIAAMVRYLMSQGYKVSADHIGYPNGRPPEFNKFIPDVYAEKEQEKIIIAAATSELLKEAEIRAEWTALSTNKEKIEFSVIVPENCFEQAKELAKKWDIKVKNFWKLKI